MAERNVVVTGAGGFIGSHLVKYLKTRGEWVRGVDIKLPEFEETKADEFLLLDLRERTNAYRAFSPRKRTWTLNSIHHQKSEPINDTYCLAAFMGGMGTISEFHYDIFHDNILINVNSIESAVNQGVDRYFFSSSACIYPEYRQQNLDAKLKEEDAYPASPQELYGWEKLVTELHLDSARKEHKLQTHIARFHNIYGPEGTYQGGREKAPAALSRKIAMLPSQGGEIEIWGDGKQTRSFCYIDDCTEAIFRLMNSEYNQPLNIGRDDMVSIDDLAYLIADIAHKPITIRHVEGPQGVRGRNSDNTLARQVLGYEPQTTMRQGLEKTYSWIEQQLIKSGDLKLDVDGHGDVVTYAN